MVDAALLYVYLSSYSSAALLMHVMAFRLLGYPI